MMKCCEVLKKLLLHDSPRRPSGTVNLKHHLPVQESVQNFAAPLEQPVLLSGRNSPKGSQDKIGDFLLEVSQRLVVARSTARYQQLAIRYIGSIEQCEFLVPEIVFGLQPPRNYVLISPVAIVKPAAA
jgi:hypothetical protein